MSKQVVKMKENGAMILPEGADNDAALGGTLSAADISLPFLRIMQGLSPQVDPDHAGYIKGVVPGDIVLTVHNKTWEGRNEGVEIVFCHFSRVFVEWRPTEAGGGIVNTYGPDNPIINSGTRTDKGKIILPTGNELIETAYHAVLVKTDAGWTEAVMPLKSTMLKVSRAQNTVLDGLRALNSKKEKVQAPRWSVRYKMTTVKEQKADKSWSVPSFTPLGWVEDDLYYRAKDWAVTAGKSANFALSEAAQAPADKPRSRALEEGVEF